MSLPTSQATPDTPPQAAPESRLRLREALRKGESPQLYEYLQALKAGSLPDLDYFVGLLLSALALYLAIVLNQPLILFVAAISAPFLKPLAGLGAAAVLPSVTHFLLSLLGLAVSFGVYLMSGWLAGLTQSQSLSHPSLPHTHLLRSTWLEWATLISAAVLAGYFFARLEERYRLASAGLAYLIFLPVGLTGYLMQVMPDQTWLAALIIAMARLSAAAFGILAGIWLAGIAPRKSSGMAITVILALLLATSAGVYAGSRFSLIALDPLPAEASPPPPTPELPAAYASSTAMPSKINSGPTSTPRPALPSATPTPAPIPAIVRSPDGIIVRAQPGSQSEVITYLNNAAEVEMLGESQLIGSTVWQKIQTADGKTGWVLARLLATPVPPKP